MNSVIDRFIRDATADEYRRVRPRRADEPTAIGLSRGLLVIIGAAVLGFVAVLAVVSARISETERRETRDELVSRVVSASDEVDALQQQVSLQSEQVDRLRSELLDAGEGSAEAMEMDRLAVDAGATELTGPGVVISMDDAPDAQPGSLNRVLDRDLQAIVNELWRAGAQGIAINDQRLVETSAIRGAGDAILVNYHPLTRPYIVGAVGPGAPMDDVRILDVLGVLAVDYGLVSELDQRDVTLPPGQVSEPRSATVLGEEPIGLAERDQGEGGGVS